MAIIKHNQAVDVARSAVVLDLGDLRRQGAIILQAARDQAAAIVAEARAERERIMAGAAETGRSEGLSQGRAEGLDSGQVEGRAAAIAEVRPRLELIETAWSNALGEFESTRTSMLRAAEVDLIRLALAIATRVTKRQVQVDPSIVVEQVRAVLGVISRPTALVVRVHPDDSPLLEAAMPSLKARIAAASEVELVQDQSIERGSCIAEMRGVAGRSSSEPAAASGGEVDATIGTQLQRIAEVLLPGGAPIEEGGGSR